MNKHLHVFIGHDDREDIEWRVAKESILDHATRPLSIYPLKHRMLRDIGLFNREWKITSRGTYEDVQDGRPFSTQFAFTRFLVPLYAEYLGINKDDPCVFMDSDFVNLSDMYGLLEEQDIEDYPVWCVKHNYQPANIIKMDNQIQTTYPMKNWSSFMVFNRSHDFYTPTIQDVNLRDGSWLHGFKWLLPEEIGSLHEGWNFIPEHSEDNVHYIDIKNIHYTEGSPLMKPFCRYSNSFDHYAKKVLRNMGDAFV